MKKAIPTEKTPKKLDGGSRKAIKIISPILGTVRKDKTRKKSFNTKKILKSLGIKGQAKRIRNRGVGKLRMHREFLK